jgi:ribosomal protein L11 methyltransferase
MFVWTKRCAAERLDLWEQRFQGNPNLAIEWLGNGGSVRLSVFCARRREAESLRDGFGGAVREVKRTEWNRLPAAPRPVMVRDSLMVTSRTRRDELATLRRDHPQRIIISIPPELAFGTGDHATTATCLRMLADAARQRRGTTWSMADLGCGTGVLAIAARRLGADDVFACDFDPLAIDVAQRNARRNRATNLTLRRQDVLRWKPRKQGYHVVVANLFSTVLIEAWPVIVRSVAPGGTLIVSGILATQAWDVFTAAARNGLGFTQVVRKGRWVTAMGGRMQDLVKA